jgi:hypothetical protein
VVEVDLAWVDLLVVGYFEDVVSSFWVCFVAAKQGWVVGLQVEVWVENSV